MDSSYYRCALMILSALWITAEAKKNSELIVYDGFPSSIPCVKAFPKFYKYRAKSETAMGECHIRMNDEVILHMNITWRERHNIGINFIANMSWNGSAINVSAEWAGGRFSQEYIIIVEYPTVSTCNSAATTSFQVKFGRRRGFPCPMQKNMRKNFTEEELKEFDVTWYRDCVAISTNDTKYEYRKWGTSPITGGLYSSFNALYVVDPSVYDYGTEFKCVVTYRNTSYEADRRILKINLPRDYIEPEILETSSNYAFSRGSTENISCSWRYTYIETVTVVWDKGDSRICGNDASPCSRVKSFNEDHTSFDLMTSVLTLNNIGDGDTGIYTCSILSPKGYLSSNISVTMMHEGKVADVTIALAIICAILLLIMIMISVYRWKRIEILYVYKRKLAKHIDTEKPITYLIYGDDSFIIDNDRNPVNDVTNWLVTRGVAFCDQSKGKEWNDTGAPIADRSIALMEQCLSLTIFLTPSLLNDNTLELFKSYSGFEENIRKKKFPIVFVCTKEFEKRIIKLSKTAEGTGDDDLKVGNSQKTYRTFLKFMRKNTVIHWFPPNNVKFYRSLYVVLPKVVERKRIPADEA